MKLQFLLMATLAFGQAFAQDIHLADYNYTVSDIARRGLTKERIFEGMDRRFIKIGSSICSNRALVWAHNMKRQYNIDSAKIFLFYTEKTGEASDKTWWYHVAPMVNENGSLWVVDAGFPRFVRRPLTKEDWLKKFVSSNNCKEITSADEDLIEKMFSKRRFPSTTGHGVYDCYYRVVAAPYWTPSSVAQNALGRNRDGEPVNFVRDSINNGELMQACMEASTTSLGGVFSRPERKCREYLGIL